MGAQAMAKKPDLSQPRRFEFVGGKSEKFWIIQLNGAEHTVQYGRLGTQGQTKTKQFDDEEAALASYEKLVAEKLNKGYEEIMPLTPAEMRRHKKQH